MCLCVCGCLFVLSVVFACLLFACFVVCRFVCFVLRCLSGVICCVHCFTYGEHVVLGLLLFVLLLL